MYKTIQAFIGCSILSSAFIYATNGDNLIGVGAKTRGMGGAGIAYSHGAESTLVNPALITNVKQTQISFGGTIFLPSIKTKIEGLGDWQESDANVNIIPEVAIVSQVKPNIFMGVGMYGTAGMGVDFRGKDNLMNMETTLQLMQFAMPLAYKYNGLSIGISPILQYGSLDIYYKNGPLVVSAGQKQDFGIGVGVGVTYDFHNGFMIGAVYKSKIKMKYNNVISTAAFMVGLNIKDNLDQPAEIGVGISYSNGKHAIAFDYKKIFWSRAAGYRDFGWRDQDVIAIGYEYKEDIWAFRVGYNYGSEVIKLEDGSSFRGAALNMFNILGFPATAKHHFTLGGSYKFSNNFSADLAIVYSPTKTTTANISAIADEIKNKHKELGFTIQFNYNF